MCSAKEAKIFREAVANIPEVEVTYIVPVKEMIVEDFPVKDRDSSRNHFKVRQKAKKRTRSKKELAFMRDIRLYNAGFDCYCGTHKTRTYEAKASSAENDYRKGNYYTGTVISEDDLPNSVWVDAWYTKKEGWKLLINRKDFSKYIPTERKHTPFEEFCSIGVFCDYIADENCNHENYDEFICNNWIAENKYWLDEITLKGNIQVKIYYAFKLGNWKMHLSWEGR